MSFTGVCITNDDRGLALSQWDYVLSHWAIDQIYILGGRPEEWANHIVMRNAQDILTAAELPDMPLIVMAPTNGFFYRGEESLVDFKHPAEAVYLFGSNHVHLLETNLGGRSPDKLVYIPVDSDEYMYSWVAAAITLYDRRAKRG